MAARADVDAPTIYCPIPFAMHPEVDRLEARSLDWLHRYGLVPDPARIAADNTAEAAALSMPVGPTDLVQIHSDMSYFGLIFDDAMGESGSAGRQKISYMTAYAQRVPYTLAVPEAGLLDPGNRFEAPWIDVARRIHACTDATRARRWAQGVGRWLDCMVWEQTSQADTVLDPNHYLVRRLGTIGLPYLVPLLEAASDVSIADRDTPAVDALFEAACTLCGLANDLCSYGKEARDGVGDSYNLVSLLARLRGLSLSEALAQTAVLFDQVMVLFVDLRDRLTPEASPALLQFLDALGHTFRGTIDYHSRARTGRYHDDDGSPLFRLAVSDIPPTLTTRIPEFSSIRWWWDHLDS
ncbi:hypothetical protein [Nocardia sp. NPDC057227]|uniref:terpene synthase family protein n=1 Tax=Nocardia sp. NPDC057227 TaxID=3346056 RepID=UPI003644ECE9